MPADSVELELTIPESSRRSAVQDVADGSATLRKLFSKQLQPA
jgi:hypothetical protein